MKSKLLLQLIMLSKNALYGILLQALLFNFIWAADTNAQEVKSVNHVEVNLDLKEATLIDVFRKIESQTNFVFSYINEEVDQSYRVTRNYKRTTLSKVLLEISRDANLKFKQVNNNINVTALERKEPVEAIEVIIQTRNITGKVTSMEDDEGLPGVNVVEKGTSNGTVTDVQGNYSLEVSEGATLVFSSVGYTQEEVEVGNRSTVDLVMNQDIQQLQELVVVGFGTQEKRELTGSVVRANIDDFRESPNVNIAQSLQGTVPGLNVGAVDEAGENPSISIRGATTINGNSNVLILLDGIIYTGSLSSLNPNDIESIDVLKDPSSMAIFGAQAANGVILITSKEGTGNEKPVFTYSGSYTTQNPKESLTFENREDFIRRAFDIDWINSYQSPEYTQLKPDLMFEDIVGLRPEIIEGFEEGTDYDWWDNTTNPGYINNHNLSVRGTSGDVNYFISAGYTKQKGFVINDEFERFTGRINISNQILPWFKIGAQTFASFADYSGESPRLTSIARLAPIVDPFEPDGSFALTPNGDQMPNAFLTSVADDFDKRNSLFGNFFLDVDIPFIEGLNYRLNFGNNYSWNRNYYSNIYDAGAAPIGTAFKQSNNRYDWTLDNIFSYKRTFGKHGLGVTLVAGRRELNFEATRAEGSNFNNLLLSYNDLSLGAIQTIRSSGWDESYVYQMARVEYEFNYKYLITATIRRDGFSGFSENNKASTFPSIGFGWILSEESFMESDLIQNLKIRGSYGNNGNLVNRYSSLARVNQYPAYVFGDGGSPAFGQEVTSLANADLSWETTIGFNFGLDFSILSNRISGSVDYYTTKTNDLIFDVNIPEISGFDQITTNVGQVNNKGLELILNTKIVEQEKFSWNINLNFSSNNNEIVSLIGLDADGDGIEDDLIASELFIGESINSIYDYETSGMIQLGDEVPTGFFEGTYRIVDQNGDDFIDPLDRVIRGREEPAYRFGILNELGYGNFTFRFFINSIQGGRDGYRMINMPLIGNPENGLRNNLWKEVDYWTPANPNARFTRLDQTAATVYNFLDNRSFVRLQDISLSYNFSTDLLQKIGFRSGKIFISGKNLITWTDFTGWDPETGNGLSVEDTRPLLRGYSIGLDFSF